MFPRSIAIPFLACIFFIAPINSMFLRRVLHENNRTGKIKRLYPNNTSPSASNIKQKKGSLIGKVTLGSSAGLGAGLIGTVVGGYIGMALAVAQGDILSIDGTFRLGVYSYGAATAGYGLAGYKAARYCGGKPGIIAWGVSTAALLAAISTAPDLDKEERKVLKIKKKFDTDIKTF